MKLKQGMSPDHFAESLKTVNHIVVVVGTEHAIHRIGQETMAADDLLAIMKPLIAYHTTTGKEQVSNQPQDIHRSRYTV